MFNNTYQIHDLAARLDGSGSDAATPPVREALKPEPCLPARLPSTSEIYALLALSSCVDLGSCPGVIEREGELSGPKEVLRQLRRSPSPPNSPKDGDEQEVRKPTPKSSTADKKDVQKPISPASTRRIVPTGWKEPQVTVYGSRKS